MCTLPCEEPASDGLYMELATGDVFDYQSLTGSLTYAFTDASASTATAQQVGQCDYVLGTWTDPDAIYQYGRCLSAQNAGSEVPSILWRLDARTVGGTTLLLRIEYAYVNESGMQPWTAFATASCGAQTTGTPVPLQDCRRPVDAPGTASTDAEPPTGATHLCYRIVVDVMEGGQRSQWKEIEPPCTSLSS